MEKLCSVFSAELSAIKHAIELSANYEEAEVTIYCDSRSAILAVSNIFPVNPIVIAIQDLLNSSQKSFTLCWVPSHIGVPGNEKADDLAKLATLSAVEVPSFPRYDLKAFAKRKTRDIWEESWRNTSGNKLREISDKIELLPNSRCSNRAWERALTRLRIGHSRATHSHLMTRSEQPTCEYCVVPLTIKHLLVECSLHNQKRNFYFPNLNGSLKRLLSEEDTTFNGNLYKFVRDIELLPLL